MNNSGFNNGANNGQAIANSDYTVNTESLVGKPSSYFQNNNATNAFGNNTNGWSGNANNLNSNANNGFNQNTNFETSPSSAMTPNSTVTPTIQNQTPTPWNNSASQISSVPWQNN